MNQIKDIDGRDKSGHQPVDGSRTTTIGISAALGAFVEVVKNVDDVESARWCVFSALGDRVALLGCGANRNDRPPI
jgi:hypothetical protein